MSTSIRPHESRLTLPPNRRRESARARWLTGIVPPMVTPLLENCELDFAGLEFLVEHMVDGGVHGIFVLGSTGEGPSLSYSLRRQLIESTIRLVAGRVPVLVGITDSSFAEAVALAGYASDLGARAVVASTPYYFRPSQDELFEYIRQLAAAVPVPLVLYNIPQITKTWFEVETVGRAFDLENVIGLKDSSGDMSYFKQLQAITHQRPEISLLIGQEEMLADSVLVGGHGGVCGGANLFPRLYVDLFQASLLGDKKLVAVAHSDVCEIGRAVFSIGDGDAAGIKGLKHALSIIGICQDTLASPLQPLNSVQADELSRRLAKLSRLSSPGIRSVFNLDQ